MGYQYDGFGVRVELLVMQLLIHKPFTVPQRHPKSQPAYLLGLKTVAIKAGRVKRKF